MCVLCARVCVSKEFMRKDTEKRFPHTHLTKRKRVTFHENDSGDFVCNHNVGHFGLVKPPCESAVRAPGGAVGRSRW